MNAKKRCRCDTPDCPYAARWVDGDEHLCDTCVVYSTSNDWDLIEGETMP